MSSTDARAAMLRITRQLAADSIALDAEARSAATGDDWTVVETYIVIIEERLRDLRGAVSIPHEEVDNVTR